MKISAVILTHNSSQTISQAISSLLWCDEVIVLDDDSVDETVTIAKKFPTKVLSRSLNSDFAAQRNFALKHAKGEWVLFVDADEEVSERLKDEIMKVTKISSADGYMIPRKDFLWGKVLKYGEHYNFKVLRLARKKSGSWKGRVHEVWNVSGKVDSLSAPLVHFSHETMKAFISKVYMYSKIRSYELYEERVSSSYFAVFFMPLGKFVQNYFCKFGLLDGSQGIMSALVMSFYTFLVRAQLWLLWQQEWNAKK